MDMKDVVRRALQALYVPRDSGFEDVIAELDKLKGSKPSAPRRAFLRQRLPTSLRAPDSRVA